MIHSSKCIKHIMGKTTGYPPNSWPYLAKKIDNLHCALCHLRLSYIHITTPYTMEFTVLNLFHILVVCIILLMLLCCCWICIMIEGYTCSTVIYITLYGPFPYVQCRYASSHTAIQIKCFCFIHGMKYI